MSKRLALLFSVIGIMLLAAIGISLSFDNLLLAGAFSLAALVFIGFGFVLKAKIRKRNQSKP